ncbi:MFS transporter [Amycolatopsis echigonensis]|uniref:MFS transporter n=1 Tax=Amycolatopsis echigonensis TaxID=2576905 RepID=A0A2N3WN57_9PSEU|nr:MULTISPECIES: MFS transporter [Amycolatopsis]MBB2503838.1 MFS transporter [Amycolatopsis echigonensis]PKV95292.1 sugar phosphate permease [Amycolatopsis niigatensis]
MSLQTAMSNRRYRVAIAISFAFFVAYFDRTNVSVLIANQEFTDSLGITGNKFAQGLLITGFLFPYGLCNFFTGPLGDKIGGRRGVIWSIIAWTVLMCAMGLVSNFVVMLVLRIVLGLGESIMTPSCNMIVAEWFPDRERARANSAWLGGLFLAPAVSFPVIVWIVNVFGWRESFFVLAAVGVLVALPMMWRWTANRPEEMAGVSPAELRHIRDGQAKPADPEPVKASLRRLFANYRYWLCVFSYMGYGLGFWGISTFVPSYLEHERHLGFTSSGTFAVIPWLTAAVLNLVGGMIGDRMPRGRVLLWSGGYVLGALLSYLGVATGTVGMSVVFISAAVGFLGFTLAPMWSVIQELTPRGTTGLGTGIANGVSYIASAFGPALVGALVDSSGSYNLGFFLLAGFLVVTALALAPLWRGHVRRGDLAEVPSTATKTEAHHD